MLAGGPSLDPMKPMLSLDLMLGTGPVPARERPSAAEDLQHRPVQLVWANGESLDTAVPTRGTALLQHGFKEWSGACGVTVVQAGRASQEPANTLALQQALLSCEERDRMPLVLSRDLTEPLRVLAEMQDAGPCGLMALGTPSAVRLADASPNFTGAAFPVRVPGGLDPTTCVWLGAPRGWARPAWASHAGMTVESFGLCSSALPLCLAAVELRHQTAAMVNLWCVIFLDDLVLGTSRPASHSELAPETLAITLRWLQRQQPWVVAFLVSNEAVTALERNCLGELSRRIGQAMYRHQGLRREPFPATAWLARARD